MDSAHIERQCYNLSMRYAALIDRGDFEGFSRLFLPEGILDLPGRYMNGRKSIVDTLSQRPKSVRIMHVFSNIMVEDVCEDRCRGIAYITAYRQDAAGTASGEPVKIVGPSTVGYYQDEFQCSGGAWFFKSRKLHALFCT